MFGNRMVGCSTTATATVTFCGDAPWSFTDVSVHPATGPAFRVSTTSTSGLTLVPGATCTGSVVFAPATPGQTSGGLWLHNTTTAHDQLITFYGRGVDAQNGSASLAFVPASADFAAQAVGTRSMPLGVELHNLGPAALTLSALILDGPGAYDFVVRNSTCQIGTAIVAGDSCQMWFYFRPLVAGTRLANLVIDSPQLASLAIMQISGVATTVAVPTVDVIEFYSAAMDHYFMSSLLPNIEALDTGHFPGWVRTGHSFKAYSQPATGRSPVCRFYMPAPQDSAFLFRLDGRVLRGGAKYPTFVFEAQMCSTFRCPTRRQARIPRQRCRSFASTTIAPTPIIAIQPIRKSRRR